MRTLAAILRLAESLDRSHAQIISGLELHDRGDDDLLQIRTTGDAELELWSAARHAAPFERLTGKPLRIEVEHRPMLNNLTQPHEYPGKLFVVEGIDGSGKTTQLALLAKWLSRRRAPGVRHRMELVRPGEGGDKNRQKEERAHPDDVQPSARHGLRRSAPV